MAHPAPEKVHEWQQRLATDWPTRDEELTAVKAVLTELLVILGAGEDIARPTAPHHAVPRKR